MPRMPEDHYKVFKAITRYSKVNKVEVYRRLGYFGETENGHEGYLVPFHNVPMQLCSPNEFREKICGTTSELPSLIHVNDKPYGIPQGAPLSDLLANAYLFDFDVLMLRYVSERGGFYYRYSDDILMLIPGDETLARNAEQFAVDLIRQFGDQLVIKRSKSCIVKYYLQESSLCYRHVSGEGGRNGLEYLGFRFDGQNVFIRDKTLSSYYRKIAFYTRRSARAFVKRYPGKELAFLLDKYNIENLISKYGRVEDFDENSDYHNWTFWSYTRRAADLFGTQGASIYQQMRGHRSIIRERVNYELQRAYSYALNKQLNS